MQRSTLLTALSVLALLSSTAAHSMIFVKIPNIGDASECQVASGDAPTLTNRLSTAATKTRSGRLELQVTCSDRAAAELSRLAATKKSLAVLEIELRETQKSFTYLRYKLGHVFIKRWTTSGDADERPGEVTGKVVLGYRSIVEEPSR
jgi:type VI protein secretion system component Hcp